MPLDLRPLTLLLLLGFLLAPLAAAAQARPRTWKQIDALIAGQRLEEAARATEQRLEVARKKGDAPEWTRALIQTVQLRVGLHGYETAVRYLREQPWPPGAVHQAALQLFYAASLVQYAQAHAWEVQQRERVASSGPVDLRRGRTSSSTPRPSAPTRRCGGRARPWARSPSRCSSAT